MSSIYSAAARERFEIGDRQDRRPGQDLKHAPQLLFLRRTDKGNLAPQPFLRPSDLPPCHQRSSVDGLAREALGERAIERFVAQHAEDDGRGTGSFLRPLDKLREVIHKRRLDAELQNLRLGSGELGCSAPRENQRQGDFPSESASEASPRTLAVYQHRHVAPHAKWWSHGGAAAPAGAASRKTGFTAGSRPRARRKHPRKNRRNCADSLALCVACMLSGPGRREINSTAACQLGPGFVP